MACQASTYAYSYMFDRHEVQFSLFLLTTSKLTADTGPDSEVAVV